MTILILILLSISLSGLTLIILPKLKLLKDVKLEKEFSFWRSMFPEFYNILYKINIKNYKENLLTDYEKFLRKIKIISLKTENLISRLLEKRAKKEKREFINFEETKKINNHEFRNKEKELIAQIAKNPKEKNLYKELGALYLENQILNDAKESYKVVLELDPNDLEAKEAMEKLEKI